MTYEISLNKKELEAVLDSLYWSGTEAVVDDRTVCRQVYRRLRCLLKKSKKKERGNNGKVWKEVCPEMGQATGEGKKESC